MFFTSLSQNTTVNRMMMEAMKTTQTAVLLLGIIAILSLACLLVVLIRYYKPSRKKKSGSRMGWLLGEKSQEK